ncbi:ATP-binding protein [Streptomyces macrosporus]|uniref:ATP-binding protein n=1 Tax=Streptomyces macrosporus TaxID=44032 RepID=UPI0031DF62C9
MNALAWALATDGDKPAREARAALERVLRHAAGPDAEPSAARPATGDGPPADAWNLATALVRRADDDGRLLDALRGWLRAHPPPHGPGGGHTNSIGGDALLQGPTVQARDIHGGIHVHQAPAAPQRPPTPRQLPPVTAHFAGRAEDLKALEALRTARPRPAPRLVVISGPAGVGKTTLASRWLGDLAEEFPDGQLYADLGGYASTGPVRPADVLDRFLRSLGVTAVPGGPAEQVALWRSVTADLRLTVLLDNAYTAAQVRPLVPGTSDSLVVVTSRQRLTGLVVDGAAVHHLRALEPGAALDLLRHGGGERVARDPETARRVVRLCAFLPLAVSLAAAHLAARPRQPLSALAAALDRGRGPLEALRVEGEAAVRTALDESYHALPEDAARVYRRLGTLPVTHYDTPLVAASCDLPVEEAERTLDLLVETNLLEDAGSDSLRFHDLVRLHAAQRGEAEESAAARREVARRFVDWCLATATAAEAILSPVHRRLARHYAHPPAATAPFEDGETALAWLDTHRHTLMAAVRLSDAAGWDATTWQLVDAMWPLFLRLRPTEMWIEAHTVGLAAARRDGDREAVGRMLTSGGNGLRDAGRIEEAADWYERALRHAEEDGDVRGQAQALNGLGNARLRAGRLDDAEAYFTRALALRESIGYGRGAALSRLCLGETALARGEHGPAIGHLSRAYDDLRAAGDTYDAARALALLGHATACAGDPAGGRERLWKAFADFRRTGSAHWQARALELLGLAARRSGEEDRARELLRRSLDIYRPLSPANARRLEDRLRAPDAGTDPPDPST